MKAMIAAIVALAAVYLLFPMLVAAPPHSMLFQVLTAIAVWVICYGILDSLARR